MKSNRFFLYRFAAWLVLAALTIVGVLSITETEARSPARRQLILGGSNSLRQGLIGYWHLDEPTGTSRKDSSGNGKDFTTLGNDPVNAAGRVGDAVSLVNASDQYLLQGDAAGYFAPAAITVAAWVNSSAFTDPSGILTKWHDSGAGAESFNLRYGSGNLQLQVRTIEGNSSTASFSIAGQTNQWHLAIGKFDPIRGVVSIRVDNKTPVEASVVGTGIKVTSANVAIGSYYSNQFVTFQWNGLVDEAAIWNRLLTESEEVQLWNGGNGRSF